MTPGRTQVFKRFLVEYAVETVAFTITLFLISLIQVPLADGTWAPVLRMRAVNIFHILIVGFLMTVATNLVRPLLAMIFGRLVVGSLGLFAGILDIFIFFIIFQFAPLHVEVQPPGSGWLWSIVGAIICNAIVVTLTRVFGVRRPHLNPDDHDTVLWRFLDSLPTERRLMAVENLRMEQVYDTLADFGFEVLLERTPLRHTRSLAQRFMYGQEDALAAMSSPAKVRVMLQQLGPTYVKLGQIMASQSSLPEEWTEELAKLQNTVPPFPYEEARKMITNELGAPPEKLFREFDHEPLAAASTAQVHRAVTLDGAEVAVKVQRPNIVSKVRADLGILQDVADVLEKRIPAMRALDLRGMIGEFAEGVMRELDYRNELYQGQRLADNMKPIEGVHIPALYPHLSTAKVLTMEFVRGIKISKINELDAAGIDRDKLAHTFIRAIVKQIMFDGFFHGDPHPGNLMVAPATSTLIFLDMGLVGELSQTQRLDLLDLFTALNRNDMGRIASVTLRLCKQFRPIDEVAYRTAIERIVYQHWVYGQGTSFSKVIQEVLTALQKNGLRMDKALTLALKTLGQCEEDARILCPQKPRLLTELAYTESQDLLKEEFSPRKVADAVTNQFTSAAMELARRAPTLQSATGKWLDQFSKGKATVELDTSQLDTQLKRFDVTMKRLTVGLIVAGLVVGLSIFASQASQYASTFGPLMPVIVVFLFIAVVLVGIYIMISMARQAGQEEQEP